jgi:hypothetical protein
VTPPGIDPETAAKSTPTNYEAIQYVVFLFLVTYFLVNSNILPSTPFSNFLNMGSYV